MTSNNKNEVYFEPKIYNLIPFEICNILNVEIYINNDFKDFKEIKTNEIYSNTFLDLLIK